MITVIAQNCKDISQESYNSMIRSLQLHQLVCSCGHSACLSVHGYYSRRVVTVSSSFRLSVCRVKCSNCGRTHAILPASVVPYDSLALSVQVDIIRNLEDPSRPPASSVCRNSLFIDEELVRSLVRRYYRFWRERLRSFRISLDCIPALVRSCFLHYSSQFMQIHRTSNKLFSMST